MTLSLPSLVFAPGRIICLHIPHGYHNDEADLKAELLQLASRQGKAAVVSQPAGFEVKRRGLFEKMTSVDWLSHAAGISAEHASELIAGLGVRVADRVTYNAGTPRCLMGLTATLIRNPDVIVYSTDGLDLEGRRRIHEFIEAKCGKLCAVHISGPTMSGDGSPCPRHCPRSAQCIDLAADSANDRNAK